MTYRKAGRVVFLRLTFFTGFFPHSYIFDTGGIPFRR